MNVIIAQSIIAEIAENYNETVQYIKTLGDWHTSHHLDRAVATGSIAAFETAMQIVARQANITLKS